MKRGAISVGQAVGELLPASVKIRYRWSADNRGPRPETLLFRYRRDEGG